MADNPFYRFFRRVSFPLERKLWDRMPRHPGFEHDYWDGALHWTPRPKTCDCFLGLDTWQPPQRGELSLPPEEVSVRQLGDEDWKVLPRLFCAAFRHWPPLSQWEGAAPLRASRCIMEWARDGKDGPLVPEACVVALALDERTDDGAERIAGAAIVTLMDATQLRGACAVEVGRVPHLDWIFVPLTEQRRAIATRLLAAVVESLRALGHRTLASTVLTANPHAMLWHWRCGFALRGD
jgi:GNAT superfamily N-acetyltransferase